MDAKLIDFSEISPPKSSEISCFLLIVSWRSFPTKFPVKSADFSKNLPLKILRNLTFFRENPAKSADFSMNFDFFPAKIPEIGQFFSEFAPENPVKFCFFFPRNIRSPDFAQGEEIFQTTPESARCAFCACPNCGM